MDGCWDGWLVGRIGCDTMVSMIVTMDVDVDIDGATVQMTIMNLLISRTITVDVFNVYKSLTVVMV
jgi:hypothetical protein